ncbi:MAG TPA: hypothetical protein PKC18_21615, partial [Lacipirellulaceae bacterium]|nr:hypothetical protein [Lacipirellulaceae bacterium]
MTQRSIVKFTLAAALVAAPWTALSWNRAAGDASTDLSDSRPTENWSQWLGSARRNNTPVGVDIPVEWEVGEFDYRTGDWKPEGAENIKWVAKLGSRSYGSAAVHDGKVFMGSNNTAAYLSRYPAEVDLGCLICFDVKDGKFLWQHSSPKLPSGRVHDWPHEGVCSVPYCEGDRQWFVTNRCEVRCLDVNGFLDGKNDGPYQSEEADIQAAIKASGRDASYDLRQEADIIWVVDMMKEF